MQRKSNVYCIRPCVDGLEFRGSVGLVEGLSLKQNPSTSAFRDGHLNFSLWLRFPAEPTPPMEPPDDSEDIHLVGEMVSDFSHLGQRRQRGLGLS